MSHGGEVRRRISNVTHEMTRILMEHLDPALLRPQHFTSTD
jgi:hypothetical protein